MTKIAVIEDETIVRENIIERLNEAGYQVVSADNGLRGIELVREQLPDLVLCDVMMPNLGGFGVLEYVRKDPATELIPFVFLSALSDKSDLRKGMLSGADDYLTKPFTREELLNAVEVRLKKKRSFDDRFHGALDQLRDSLSRSLPHEFLTPLNSILGLSSLMHDHMKDFNAEEILEMLRHINQAGQRLHRLVQNYLRFTELESARQDTERAELLRAETLEHPDDIIRDIAGGVAERARRPKDVSVNAEKAAVAVSARNLEKLVEELVDNACKFSLDGVPIMVSARLTDGWYELVVSDKGRGMTDEQRRSIGAYMQFDRLEHEQRGVGLGLALVHSIVELHRGRMSIESELGKFTRVTVLLPEAHFG